MKNICFTALFILVIQFTVSAQFKEGYIIDKYGKKYIGLVKIVEGIKGAPDYVLYKESKNSDKIELPKEKLKSFRIETDSFVAVNNFRIPGKKTVLNGFAKVIMATPNGYLCELNDLKASPNSSSSPVSYMLENEKMFYLILRKDVFTLLTKSNFQPEMSVLIADSPELIDKVKTKKIGYDKLMQLVAQYNKSE